MLIGTLVYVAAASDARADPVVLTEKPEHVTEAVVIVDAPSADIYALATDYAHWPTVLSDVTSVKVEAGGPRDAKVRFRSKALGHEVAVVFDNVPDRAIRFHSVDAPPGAHAHGEYLLQPIDGGRRTRRAKLEHDLLDTAHWLASHHGAAA